MFHVVVDNADVASKLLNLMDRERMEGWWHKRTSFFLFVVSTLFFHLWRFKGYVSFLPLDELHVPPTDYPSSNLVLPLISHIRFEPRIDKAVKLVRHIELSHFLRYVCMVVAHLSSYYLLGLR